MRNQIISISIIMALAMVFALTMVSAVSTLNAPVNFGNYTKSLTISLTIASNGPNNMTNVSCYYNATGGAATTALVEILNTTVGGGAAQTAYSGVGTLTTEGYGTYNISCEIMNDTSLNKTISRQNITIDGTNPVVSISAIQPRIAMDEVIDLSWSDADTKLQTTTVSVVSPNANSCPTLSYTDATRTLQLMNSQTRCDGTYTATIIGTDYSGNTATATDTWVVDAPDGNFMGEHTNLGTNNVSNPSSSNTNWVILIVAIIIIVILVTRKK